MPRFTRALTAILVSLGLAMTLLVAAPQPASAIEVKGVTLSSTQWRAGVLSARARNTAMNARGTQMNYRKMKTVFGTKNAMQVSWRRQMAAGFRQAGGRIVYISKAENRQVEAMRKRIYRNRSPHRIGTTVDRAAFKVTCKGRTGTVVRGNYTYQYLNSCEVIDLLWAWGGCVSAMGALGFVAGGEKRVSWPAYAVAAICGYQAGVIAKEAQKSANGAVYIRTYKQEAYQPYPGQVRYFIRIDTFAQ